MYWTLKRMLSWGGIILLVSTIVIYAYIQAQGILEGPDIILESPLSQTSTTSLVEVSGYIKNARATTLDGRGIFIDTAGRFNEKLLLSEGYNIIVLTAEDAQGRMKRKTFEIIYKDPNPPTAIPATGTPQFSTGTESVIQ